MPLRSKLQRMAAATLAAVALADLADAQSCAVPASTLSFTCGGGCPAASACMLKAASSACDLECFSSSSSAVFTFLIPYDASVGDTQATAHKSNDALTRISKWKLPPAITDVCVLEQREWMRAVTAAVRAFGAQTRLHAHLDVIVRVRTL